MLEVLVDWDAGCMCCLCAQSHDNKLLQRLGCPRCYVEPSRSWASPARGRRVIHRLIQRHKKLPFPAQVTQMVAQHRTACATPEQEVTLQAALLHQPEPYLHLLRQVFCLVQGKALPEKVAYGRLVAIHNHHPFPCVVENRGRASRQTQTGNRCASIMASWREFVKHGGEQVSNS